MVYSLVDSKLDKLREEILSCNRCPLNQNRVVHGLWKLPGFGHPSADIIFIAEAPSGTGGCREGLYYSTTNSVFYWYLKEAGFRIPIDRITISALGRLSRQEKKLEMKIDEKEGIGVYANVANVIHNRSEFVLDFARIMPGLNFAKVVSRVILSPANIKALSMALEHNIKEFEKKFGEIKISDKKDEKRIGF